jgi:hypothetical protein
MSWTCSIPATDSINCHNEEECTYSQEQKYLRSGNLTPIYKRLFIIALVYYWRKERQPWQEFVRLPGSVEIAHHSFCGLCGVIQGVYIHQPWLTGHGQFGRSRWICRGTRRFCHFGDCQEQSFSSLPCEITLHDVVALVGCLTAAVFTPSCSLQWCWNAIL